MASYKGRLPADAQQLLKDAAQIKDPFKRAKAIDAATQKIKRKYPEFFK